MKWRKISYKEITSPEFQAQQRDHAAGVAAGRLDYARFEERREFVDLVAQPSEAWVAGYNAGYSRAERGLV